MAKKSRDKGKLGEREVGHMLTDWNFDHARHQDGTGQPCDFEFEGIVLEVRRREQLRIVAWSNEIEDKTPDHKTPAVAYRTNGEPWRVSLPLIDFLDLVRAAGS